MSESAQLTVREQATRVPVSFDPFQLMDRLDEEALKKELEGIASTELVYVVKEGGQEVVGLSKVGVDECCMVLVAHGQVIREEDLEHELIGEGEDREALFKVTAARFAVSPAGQEVRLDQVIGVKRQPLYYEPAQLDLDTKAPSKKYRGKTYRDLLSFPEGRDYLAWMVENFNEPEIRDFARKILDGEDVTALRGKQLNPHWYEAGAMKAARNARFRLIPGSVRAQIIATARQAGAVREVNAKDAERQASAPQGGDVTDQLRREEEARRAGKANGGGQQTAGSPTATAAPATSPTTSTSAGERTGPYAPSEKQIAFYARLADSPVFSEEERKRALEWLATKATRQTIKDQIDWLKRQVESRKGTAVNDDAGAGA